MQRLYRSLPPGCAGEEPRNWQSLYEIRRMLVLPTLREGMPNGGDYGADSVFAAVTGL